MTYMTAAEWAETAYSEVQNSIEDWPTEIHRSNFGPSEFTMNRFRDEADSEGGRWAEMLRQGRAATEDAVLFNPTNHCFRENSATDMCASCGVHYGAHTGCDCDEITPSERAYGIPDSFAHANAVAYIARMTKEDI